MGSQRRRQSAEVYRRRRIVAVVLAVVLLALIGWLTALAFGGEDDGARSGPVDTAAEEGSAAQDADDSASGETGADPEDQPADQDLESEAQEPPNEPAEDGSCRTGDLEVRASTGSESYGPGFAPRLVMEVENTADYACEADLGTAEQEFVVEHGGSIVFSTAECSLARDSLPMELEPGQVEQAHFTWPRSDSAEDCAEPTSLSPGSYELTVSLSGVRSEPHDFALNEG